LARRHSGDVEDDPGGLGVLVGDLAAVVDQHLEPTELEYPVPADLRVRFGFQSGGVPERKRSGPVLASRMPSTCTRPAGGRELIAQERGGSRYVKGSCGRMLAVWPIEALDCIHEPGGN
jgi:hypothetical protein